MVHWFDDLLDHVRPFLGDKRDVVINGGLSVSGLQHVGRLRGEIVLGHCLARTLRDEGRHVTQLLTQYTQDQWKGKEWQLSRFPRDEGKRFVGWEPVFDLTVPEAANFVANDIFVHNSTYARCGIITNVTPLEPEWEGYVTLEISNTTPLPARIYANEGIAQVLFFESDEDCSVSYKDKQGKYQAQIGITLPTV